MTNYIARAGDPELDMIPDHDKYLMRELCRDLPLPVIAEKFEVDSLIVALVYLEGRDA